jgi:hypothetical protein
LYIALEGSSRIPPCTPEALFQVGAFLRTTLPLALDALADYDSGR